MVLTLLVHAAALLDDLGDLVPTLCCGVFVGLLGGLGRGETLGRGAFGCPLGEVILLRNDGSSYGEAISTCVCEAGLSRSRGLSGSWATRSRLTLSRSLGLVFVPEVIYLLLRCFWLRTPPLAPLGDTLVWAIILGRARHRHTGTTSSVAPSAISLIPDELAGWASITAGWSVPWS